MSTTESHEHQATDHALAAIYAYISPGTNEGISYAVSRLTDDLFTDSFLGGGDISLFSASGHRGTIKSQLSNGYQLSSGGGAPATFSIEVTVDLNTAKAVIGWTLPGGSPQTATISLDVIKEVARPEGKNYLFGADEVSDAAAYTLSLILM